MIAALLLIAAVVVAAPAHAARLHPEFWYAERACRGMELEVVTPSGARADCVGAQHAYEVDFADKWAQAIGQALLYSHELNRRAGIILICEGNCERFLRRLRMALPACPPVSVRVIQGAQQPPEPKP